MLDDRFNKKVEAIETIFHGLDELSTVVRVHIHIEHELQDFIYFAAPSPTQLKSMDKMEFSEKVRLALVLGFNADLKSALNAIGNLRNDYAHRLDMKLGEDRVGQLLATLTPAAKQQADVTIKEAFSAVSNKPKFAPAARSLFRMRMKLMAFCLRLFCDVAKERHRVAFEKLQGMAWH